MQFPTQKADILSLANAMIHGLAANPADFPDPPFSSDSLVAFRQETRLAMLQRQAAHADLKNAIAAENKGLAKLNHLIQKVRQASEGYQPEFPEHFLKIMSAVHSNPRLIPLAYLRRFGILL
jgi:hypothetical protein